MPSVIMIHVYIYIGHDRCFHVTDTLPKPEDKKDYVKQVVELEYWKRFQEAEKFYQKARVDFIFYANVTSKEEKEGD